MRTHNCSKWLVYFGEWLSKYQIHQNYPPPKLPGVQYVLVVFIFIYFLFVYSQKRQLLSTSNPLEEGVTSFEVSKHA